MRAIDDKLKLNKTISLKVNEDQYNYYMAQGGSPFLRQFLNKKATPEEIIVERLYERLMNKMYGENQEETTQEIQEEKTPESIKEDIKTMFNMFD